MCGAAYDQLALVALATRPACEPGRDDLLGERIELRLLGYDRLFKLDLGFRQRAAAHMGVEEIRSLGQRRAWQADGQIDDPVLNLTVLRDQHDQRAVGLEPHELD